MATLERLPVLGALAHVRGDEDRPTPREVDDGDVYRFGEAEAEVFFVPGHTSGHCALLVEPAGLAFMAAGAGTVFVLRHVA